MRTITITMISAALAFATSFLPSSDAHAREASDAHEYGFR